jgi:hypothetical protein
MTDIAKSRHPHAEAQYRIRPREAMDYAVEVTIPDMNPTTVTGFATQQEAASWVAGHRQRVASGPLRMRWRRPSTAANGEPRNVEPGDATRT